MGAAAPVLSAPVCFLSMCPGSWFRSRCVCCGSGAAVVAASGECAS